MDLKAIGEMLAKAEASRDSELLQTYSDNFVPILSAVQRHTGVKTNLKLSDSSTALDAMRVAVITNDLTIVNLPESGEDAGILALAPKGIEEAAARMGGNFSIATNRADKMAELAGQGNPYPAFMMPTGKTARALLSEIAPIIRSGRLLALPRRGALSLTSEDSDGRRTWTMHGVDESSSPNLWTVRFPDDVEPSVTKVGEAESPGELNIGSITMPFVTGIGFKELSKILDDESLHINKLRIALTKAAATAAESNLRVDEVINDIVRPEIETLTRTFDKVTQANSLKQSGAIVGTAVVAISAVATGGLVQAAAALGGAAGLGVLYRQDAEYREKLAELKENPHYLLWRIQNLKRGKIMR